MNEHRHGAYLRRHEWSLFQEQPRIYGLPPTLGEEVQQSEIARVLQRRAKLLKDVRGLHVRECLERRASPTATVETDEAE